MEIWKNVRNYEKLYQVSNYGRIRSLDRKYKSKLKYQNEITKKGKILKPIITKNGYQCVNLSKNGKTKMFFLHKIIADCFLNKNDFKYEDEQDKKNAVIEKLDINHKDENKSNNKVENLEYCTRKYNINYGTHNERKSEKQSISVIQLDKNNNIIKEWKSIANAGNILNINKTNISLCCKKKRKTAGGYVWEYKKQ